MIALDEIDEKIIEKVNANSDGIIVAKLKESYAEFAEMPENTFRYRIDSLAAVGKIQTKKRRKYLFCYPIRSQM
jgi:hypothetical protein